VKPRDPEWAIGDLTAALIIGVEEVLVVLGWGEALVDDEDDGGDEEHGDEELAIVDTEGLSKRQEEVKQRNKHKQKYRPTWPQPAIPMPPTYFETQETQGNL